MLSTRQLCFLRTKIHHMRTAMLHCPDGAFFNLRAVMVRILELDEPGYLWLAADKPAIDGETGFESFDILLNYYIRGVSFDLDILGEASICTDETAINSLTPGAQAEYSNGNLLLKVRIIDIDYWECTIPIIKRIAGKILRRFPGPTAEKDSILHLPPDKSFA